MSAYKWKSASRIKADAQKAGELMEQLSETEDGLTAHTLLEASKPEDAILHNEYEWDDAKAATEWRLHTSRNIINSIMVVAVLKEEGKDEPTEVNVRGFLIADEESKYEQLEVIVNDVDKRAAMLETALRELEAFRRKYKTLSELQPVFTAIDTL